MEVFLATHRISFTKPQLANLPLPKVNQNGRAVFDTYHDTKEAGLVLLVTSGGSKTFYLYKKIHGRPERIKLGGFPDLSVENARKSAAKHKGQIAGGKNPNDERKKLRTDLTFGAMFQQYMDRYSRKQKRSWQYDEREVTKFLSSWFNRKASSITHQQVRSIHERLGNENGIYAANRLLERIRAIFNKSIEWGWEGTNPALGIKKFKEKSRDRFLQPDELPKFFEALAKEENDTTRDYIWLSLLTGGRKANVLAMRWEEINFDRAEWRIPATKNGDPLTVALATRAIEILSARQKKATSDWVFPSENSASGHLADPKKAWKRVLGHSGIKDLRIHDLRRSLGSWQASTGANSYIIGKSLGHKSQQSTAVYARLNLHPVRASVELATQAMITAGNKSTPSPSPKSQKEEPTSIPRLKDRE